MFPLLEFSNVTFCVFASKTPSKTPITFCPFAVPAVSNDALDSRSISRFADRVVEALEALAARVATTFRSPAAPAITKKVETNAIMVVERKD